MGTSCFIAVEKDFSPTRLLAGLGYMNKNESSLIAQRYATTVNAQIAWRMERQHRIHQTRKGCVYDVSFHEAERLLRGYGSPATTTKRQSIKCFLCILLLPIERESIQLESLLDGFSCPLSFSRNQVSSRSRPLPIELDQQV
jgi:hypothetical protein